MKFKLGLAVFLFAGVVFAHPHVEEYVGDTGVDEGVSCKVESADQESAWNTIAIVGGAIALINLLMQILRLRTIGNFLKERKKLWLKPFISIALGALLGGLTAYQTGVGLFQSIIAGLMSGVAAVGLHETLNKRRPEKRLK